MSLAERSLRGFGLRALLGLFALGIATPALAGGRPRYGGALKVAAAVKAPERDPLLADTPAEATLSLLSATPPCRLGTFEAAPTGNALRLVTAAGASADTIARALERVRTSPSPYRALLAPVKSITTAGTAVDLHLAAPAPELELALCHPALAAPVGPFSGPTLSANGTFPAGRPYLDAATVTPGDARSAERALAQRRAHVVLGVGSDTDGPQLFATWLVTSPKLAPHLKPAVESSLERADLVRFFVHAPASALPGLLPPALGGPTSAPPPPARPEPLVPAVDVTLLYDAALEDHRAVAERLQVKLQPLGYRVVLTGLPRAELRTRWAKGDYELLLFSALLPDAAGPALALTAEIGHQPDALGAEAFAAADEKATQRRADTLRATLPLVPLYVQGLALGQAREARHLVRDRQGLPHLDDVFLSPD